jgi:hypothetical protein
MKTKYTAKKLESKRESKNYELFKEKICSKVSGIFEKEVIRSQIKNYGIVTK